MTTPKVGFAGYQEMKDRSMRIARGEERLTGEEPSIWFTSAEAFAAALSAGHPELLHLINEQTLGCPKAPR